MVALHVIFLISRLVTKMTTLRLLDPHNRLVKCLIDGNVLPLPAGLIMACNEMHDQRQMLTVLD